VTTAIHLTGPSASADFGATGSGNAESWPHASQKRPLIALPHAGQALEVAGVACAVSGVPQTSQ
jgi:hypothetical protein